MENILYYLTVIIGTVIFCVGVILFLKSPFLNLTTSSGKQLDIILDGSLDDKEKDRLILQNVIKVLGTLFLCLIILCLLALAGIFPVYLYLSINNLPEGDTSSVYFYTSLIIGSFSILAFRRKGNYSYWSKLLHIIVLDNYALGKFLLDRELKQLAKKTSTNEEFIIVSGLARAGTTALTNLIFNDSIFHSIKYSNMPFLLAPKLWKRIYNPTKVKYKERAHKDNVLFSEASIEALEEYFFKAHLNDSFIKDQYLEKHEVSKDLLEKYYNYQALFQDQSGTKYLAKNNNFILRYESIRKQNPKFKAILIFRNPVDHAKSLLKQHNNFIEKQTEDGFILKYMNWLGHHEFGLHHKHFALTTTNIGTENDKKDSLTFWLTIWINYYNYILKIYRPGQNLLLVHYQDLATNPSRLRKVIGEHIGIELAEEHIKPFTKKMQPPKIETAINVTQTKEALEIYEKLKSNKITLV